MWNTERDGRSLRSKKVGQHSQGLQDFSLLLETGVRHFFLLLPQLTTRLSELMSFFKLLSSGFQDCDLTTKGNGPKELGIEYIV
jgi:hypothetical protein